MTSYFRLLKIITLYFFASTKIGRMVWFGLAYGVQCHAQQYFSYIVAVSFIGGVHRSTRRKPPTETFLTGKLCHSNMTSFIGYINYAVTKPPIYFNSNKILTPFLISCIHTGPWKHTNAPLVSLHINLFSEKKIPKTTIYQL